MKPAASQPMKVLRRRSSPYAKIGGTERRTADGRIPDSNRKHRDWEEPGASEVVSDLARLRHLA